jgi:hypothetical protein
VIDVLAAINFRPEIAGILVVMVGVMVLLGSVYLILATDTGVRLGFLLALAGFFGWMFIMGVTWWIYGIGYKGPDPSWQIDEIVFGEMSQSASDDVQQLGDRDAVLVAALTAADPDASALAGSQIPKSLSDVAGVNPWLVEQATSDGGAALLVAGDEVVGYVAADGDWVSGNAALSFSGEEVVDETGNSTAVEVVTYRFDTGGWNVIEGADPFRGEAQAAADAALVENVSSIEATSQYVALGTFDLGGKPRPEGDGVWDSVANKISNTFRPTHPEHYAVVQAQVVVPQEPEPGEAPPLPVIDEEQPVMSVVMTRDLGSKRLPPALITLFSLAMLLLLSWMLHARDERAAELEGPDQGKT